MENLNLADLNLSLEESREREILKSINASRAMNCCTL